MMSRASTLPDILASPEVPETKAAAVSLAVMFDVRVRRCIHVARRARASGQSFQNARGSKSCCVVCCVMPVLSTAVCLQGLLGGADKSSEAYHTNTSDASAGASFFVVLVHDPVGERQKDRLSVHVVSNNRSKQGVAMILKIVRIGDICCRWSRSQPFDGCSRPLGNWTA
jgi:hypothetical protein